MCVGDNVKICSSLSSVDHGVWTCSRLCICMGHGTAVLYVHVLCTVKCRIHAANQTYVYACGNWVFGRVSIMHTYIHMCNLTCTARGCVCMHTCVCMYKLAFCEKRSCKIAWYKHACPSVTVSLFWAPNCAYVFACDCASVTNAWFSCSMHTCLCAPMQRGATHTATHIATHCNVQHMCSRLCPPMDVSLHACMYLCRVFCW